MNAQEDYHFDFTYIGSEPVEDSQVRMEQTSEEKRNTALRETLKYFGYLFGLYR